MAGDVGNAYLMATTDEKVVFEGGPELEHYLGMETQWSPFADCSMPVRSEDLWSPLA